MRLQLPSAYAFILWEYVKFINRLLLNFLDYSILLEGCRCIFDSFV